MVSCLILYHTTITSLTKWKVLCAMFKGEDYEMFVEENNTVIIYIWNIDKDRIWQAATDFETTNIITGYGFGQRKSDAKREAYGILHLSIDDAFLVNDIYDS